MPNEILVMTATLEPAKDVYELYLKDSKARLFQLLCSLVCWIKHTNFQKILVCENSGHAYDFASVKTFAREYQKELEIIRCPPQCPAVKRFGKGYGEGHMLEYVMGHSHLMEKTDIIFKISGRLFISHFEEIRTRYAHDKNVFSVFQSVLSPKRPYTIGESLRVLGNVKNNVTDKLTLIGIRPMRFMFYPHEMVDSRFYKCEVAYFKTVLEQSFRHVDDRAGHYLQHVYHDYLFRRKDYRMFEETLQIVGQSGSTGDWYEGGDYTNDTKQTARELMSR